jgi:hypothetical protein
MFNVAATSAAVAHATAATARSIPMDDRARVVETLRKEGVVLVVDHGYQILLTSATRWVWETNPGHDKIVPAWGSATIGYASRIFAVLDGEETLEQQDARHAAAMEAFYAQEEGWV